MIRVQNAQKYFERFQSLTVITQLELGITDGVSVGLVSINVWRLVGDSLNITCNFLYSNQQEHRDLLKPWSYATQTVRKSGSLAGGLCCSVSGAPHDALLPEMLCGRTTQRPSTVNCTQRTRKMALLFLSKRLYLPARKLMLQHRYNIT
jgi:hypothetical protein